jgi:hypothetical protein
MIGVAKIALGVLLAISVLCTGVAISECETTDTREPVGLEFGR